MVKFGQKVAF